MEPSKNKYCIENNIKIKCTNIDNITEHRKSTAATTTLMKNILFRV